MGIKYDVWETDYYYQWLTVSEPTGITSDDGGVWLDLGFDFLYYGVVYNRVWVCSNGFITLSKTATNANPQSIPSTSEPNPVIAVFWRNLHPERGGSITYGRNVAFTGGYYFVVSWNNVPDDKGDPQTFQVLIRNQPSAGSDFHNWIFFQYKNITKTYSTTIGIEDQVGNKGTAYNYNNLHNQACLKFEYPVAGYRLQTLKIKLTKTDSYAIIEIMEKLTGGYNVILKDYTNPWGDDFKFAIKTTATLLLWKAGIIWKATLIIADLAGLLAADLSPIKEDYTKDAGTGENEAWARADCVGESSPYKPFDSTLATTIEWIFTDANDKDHTLTVTAEACYKDIGNNVPYTISTSATLNMYSGGGGCPTLFVWNGMNYANEGILNIHAESDVTVQHQIQNALALENGVYKLQLRELDNFTSHIDQVKLYAVDNEGKLHLCPLTYAYHSELGRVKQTLLLDDGNRVDLEPTEIIDLKFSPSIPYSKTANFIFEINGYNAKMP